VKGFQFPSLIPHPSSLILHPSSFILYPSSMRLIMMGTGPFAVPTFKQLYQAGHDVVLLVTRPLRSHRGKEVEPASAMRDIAREHGTPLYEPESVNTPEAETRLTEIGADLLVVCDYGQILAPATLATARLGGINLHGSLLPKYRGAAPINWALFNGESETGVTVIHMTPKVDAGPCIAQEVTKIDPEETAVELEARLAELGGVLVRKTIENLARGPVEALSQDASLASKAPRLKKTDGAIDWARPALCIKNQIRALEPWPRTYTFWHRGHGEPLRMILGPSDVVDATQSLHVPGTVLVAAGDRLVIAAGQGALAPRTVQLAGKRPLGIAELLRGHKIQSGERFGPDESTPLEPRR
jgi:methionyl-tRNA formyltransferase